MDVTDKPGGTDSPWNATDLPAASRSSVTETVNVFRFPKASHLKALCECVVAIVLERNTGVDVAWVRD